MLKYNEFINAYFLGEGKMPDKFIGNDEIVFLKTKEYSKGAHYNLYYKGHDIDTGGYKFGSEKELKDFAADYILSNQLYNKLKYEKPKSLPESINEGGNAVDEARPMTQEETKTTYAWLVKNVYPLLGIIDGSDAKPIGSFGKKKADQTSGDIDIAVAVDRIAGINGISVESVLEFVKEKLDKAGYPGEISKGFNQVSFGVPIGGDSNAGIGQIDFMFTDSLTWSEFMYHSPDFTAAESKYKGLYRNILLMKIISNSKRAATKLTDAGEVEEYESYVVRLNQGVVKVTKSYAGKKGLLKNPKLLKDQDQFISNTPEEVTRIAFGEGIEPSDIMTFENIWMRFTDPKFIHRDKFDSILKEFIQQIKITHVPIPTEVEEEYPNMI